jgi:hypothetical protein
MEAVDLSRMLVKIAQTTQQHVPEGSILFPHFLRLSPMCSASSVVSVKTFRTFFFVRVES